MPSTKQIKLGNIIGFKPESRTFKDSTIIPVSDHYVGIEIEAEEINVNLDKFEQLLNYWTIVQDGSLRNNGAEFISVKLRGRDIELALAELQDILHQFQIVPIYSKRTSTHLHADIRGLTFESLQLVILAYAIVEPYLFKYLAHNRHTNAYCAPWYTSSYSLAYINKILNLTEDIGDNLRYYVENLHKYHALNLRAIINKGSIEFRQHYGTNNPTLLLKWINTILYLIENIKSYDKNYIISTINEGNTYALFNELCPYIEVENDNECIKLSHRNIIALTKKQTSVNELIKELFVMMHDTEHPAIKKDNLPPDFLGVEEVTEIINRISDINNN